MDRGFRVASALFLLVVVASLLSSQAVGFGGDGNITYMNDSNFQDPCDNPLTPPEVCRFSCWNEEDDNSHDGTDTDDLSCVKPSTGEVDGEVRDDTEGNIWDNDLTHTLRDKTGNTITRSVMFDGIVYRGSNTKTMDRGDVLNNFDDYYAESQVNNSRGEGENWAFGGQEWVNHYKSSFPHGTYFDTGKVIYPPNDLEGKGEGEPESCGDGYENEDSVSKDGDDGGIASGSTDCMKDYGMVNVKYEKPAVTEGQESPEAEEDESADYIAGAGWCRDDGMDSSGTQHKGDLSCDDGDDASCSGGDSSYPGCSDETCTEGTDADCDDYSDISGSTWSGDNGNYYWFDDGDKLVKDTCSETSNDWEVSGTGGSGTYCDTHDSYCSNPGVNDTCDGYSCDTGSDWCSSGSDDSTSGDYRDWTEAESINCDSQYSQVKGGASSDSVADGDRNDEAATYTEFTAYEDGSWGSDGKVWCGYEFTTTVDADGPRGYGDGFVVISTRGSNSVEGTWAHNGEDDVGKRIWVETDGSGGEFKSAQGKIDKTCKNGRDVCLKYVDYWTESDGLDSWTTDSSGSGWKEGVRASTRVTMYPEDSYSVCKNINRIAGKQLVRCDYIRDSEPVSPLNASCGNKPRERMITAEGGEVHSDEMDEFLAYQQECVQYDQDPGSYSGSESTDISASAYCENGPPSSTEAELAQDWISSVEFNEIDRNSKGDFDDGYQDFTDTWTPVRQGSTYELNVDIGMSDYYSQTAKVFIDWDGDDSFNDAIDTRKVIGSCDAPGCEVSTTVDVPSGASTGLTMMRIGERYADEPPICSSYDTSYTHGEVEDYSVRVLSSGRPEITENACVLDGKVYPEGSVENVANNKEARFHDFEGGGDSADKEVCLDIVDSQSFALAADEPLPDDMDAGIVGDHGGEWYDIDYWGATRYLRNNVVDSKEYLEYWENNPDKKAKNVTGVKEKYKEPGMALEDDCAATINNPSISCEDQAKDIGRQTPVFAKFYEGARDDDYAHGETWLDVSLDSFHNRVQSGGNTGHNQDFATRKQEMVDYEYQWNEGGFYDTEVQGQYLNTTEQRGSANFIDTLEGTNVYGVYNSTVFEKTPEKYFTNITAFHNFSGGSHPLVVKVAEDEDFQQNVRTEKFWMNSSKENQTYQLGALENHRYLRFKLGLSTAPKPAQVAFVVDETGSMGSIQNEIQNEAKEFMEQLGPNSEAAVIGYREDYSGNDKVYQTFTDDKQTVKDAIDDLEANGYEEATGKGVGAAMNELTWDATASKAIIHVQDGNSCTCDKDPQDYETEMNNEDITFYNVETGSEWGTELYNMAQNTDGRHWETPGNWSQILDEISTDLAVLPKDPSVDKIRVTARTPPSAGTGNTQDDEPAFLDNPGHPEYLNWSENSNIDPEDDEWAYTPTLEWAIANNGTAWPPGACYGSPREQGVDKWKNQSTYANSYAKATNDVWGRGYSAGEIDGNWVNPDNTSLSVTEGLLTCDLTGHDWGYAVENASVNGINPQLGSDYDETSNPGSPGIENNLDEEIPMALSIEKSEFSWDMDHHHPRDPKTNLTQWKGACGDDRNEYLIREHAATMGGEYNPTFAGRSDYFACADRPTDCVLDNKVYSEGMIVDVSSVANNEHGDNSRDQEICLDINDELPGGEWWDVDNESIRKHIVDYDDEKSGSGKDPYLYVKTGNIDPLNPGHIFWHNGSREGANEVNRTPYNPVGEITDSYYTGYALEDDCDPDLTPAHGCDDTGAIDNLGNPDDPRRNPPGLVYSPFRESAGGNQVVFAVDETYSMGPVFEGVVSNIKWFYEGFTSVEGTVVGSGCDADSTSYGDYHCLEDPYPGDNSGSSEPRDVTPGNGLTSDLNTLKAGADNLRERTSSEGPDDTVSEAVGYGAESNDYTGNVGMYGDENYDFHPNAAKAVIWVQDGGTRGSCSGVSDSSEGSLGDYMVDNNFQFYAIVRDLSGCRSNYEDAASMTGGQVYDLSSDPDSSDWQDILADIRSSIDGGRIEVKADDYSTEGTWAVKMYAGGSHSDGRDGSTHAGTGQMSENTPGVNFDSSDWGWPTSNLNDSKIDPREDTWAIADKPWDAVGPTGAVYDVGSCYGASPPDYAEGWVLKNETVMANSYASREEANVDGGDEGNWVDPDTTFKSVSNGSLSCDLNSTDWGIGFNTGVGSSLEVITGDAREYGYEVSDEHAVHGPITFDQYSDPLGGNQDNLQQYPDACGDDQNEYLIREQVSHRGDEHRPNLTHRDNIYVCADRITDCAYNGHVFSEGQTADLSALSPGHTDPEVGDNISDREICLDLNKTTPGGEWYDKDQNFTVKNKIYGLDDTFQLSENSSSDVCKYNISGRVRGVDTQYGDVEIEGQTTNVDSSGRFSYTNVELDCGTMRGLNYVDVGFVQAQKKLLLPDSNVTIEDLVISKELTYQPIEVWNGIENFRDNYHDVNPGTDWKNPSTRYDREEVSYFNRTHSGQNSTQPRTLTSSIDMWASGEPNDYQAPPGEDCGEFYGNSGGTWNDIWCDKKQNALCEYEGYREYEETAPKKWHVAKELCEARGGHLAVIETVAENNYIESNYGNVLIGLHQPDPTPASIEPDEGWQWVNSSGTYRPEGYATEDDCGPLMRKSGTGPCGDVGPGVQDKPWFSASNFSFGGVSP